MDRLLLGRHLRAHRRANGLTLGDLSTKTGIATSQLSMFENGRREPRLAQLNLLATALQASLPELLSPQPPDARSALEIELERYQRSGPYQALSLPAVAVSRTLPQETLEALIGLHRELRRRDERAIATPEEARRANTELRLWLRDRDHYLLDLEAEAANLLAVVQHEGGALTHRTVSLLAEHLGFSIFHVDDLPHSTRSITDLERRRIYLPPASIPGGHGLRSLALQAMAHRVLGHEEPISYAAFLRQRLEINYFAAACLLPQAASVNFLQAAKQRRDIAVEDFRDAFGVTHETAALRMMNLATAHLGLPLHFLRVRGDGTVLKGYENDGLPLPTDASGSVEGQPLHPRWASRAAFLQTNRTTEYYQLTDTPAGTYWCSTQTGTSPTESFSISVGVRFADSKWFRGRDTSIRADARGRIGAAGAGEPTRPWAGRAWPSAKLHAHILSPLPSGSFPGVDDVEVEQFLAAHAAD